MALTDTGEFILTEADLAVATGAADPTDAWLLHEDGHTSLDPSDYIDMFTVPGYWPRYLMRAGSAAPFLEQYPTVEAGLAVLTSLVRRNLGSAS